MVSYYNPLSYGQCANLYPNTGYWNNLPGYQQQANAASAASLFGGGNVIHNNGVSFGGSSGGGSPAITTTPNNLGGGSGSSSNGGGGGGAGGGAGSVASNGGGSPDSEGQSPMYYQHYQHAMFQQGSPEWHVGDRSGSPPTVNGQTRTAAAQRGFPYPGIAVQNPHHKMGNMMMNAAAAAATDLRTNMDKLGHLTALPSPPISSPGGNCQPAKAGKTRTEDKYRVVYTDFQRMELEKEYNTSRYITIRRKTELSHSLDLSERQVKIWFQNRRAKDRKLTKKRDEVISSTVGMHQLPHHHPHHAHHHHQHQLQQTGAYPEDALAFNAFDIKPKMEPGLHLQHAAFHHQMNQHMHGMGLHHHAAANYPQHGLHPHHHHNLGAMPTTNIPPSIAPADSPASIN